MICSTYRSSTGDRQLRPLLFAEMSGTILDAGVGTGLVGDLIKLITA